MSGEVRHCASCGTEIPRPEARFCEHCGAALPLEPEPPPPDPFGDVAARFRALAAHPELPGLLAARPEVPELAGKTLPSFLLLLLVAALGLLASLVCLQLCPPLGFAPLALVVVGFLVLSKDMLWNARTPIVARPAMVVELRARLQAGAEHSPSHTRHHVTLQFEGGERAEHECFASALASLEIGALGVAYLKGERLAAFTRLAV
jgi:hypothetical protein